MSQISPQPPHLPGDVKVSTLRRLRRLSKLFDSAIGIPGTPFRFGLDPILGLFPGGGDFVGATVSLYIVLEAARLGIPRDTLVQMVSNIILDTVAGTVPVLGDLVDLTWKANVKNIALLEDHLNVPSQSRQQANWWFVALLVGLVLLVVVGVAAISVIIFRWLLGAISG